MGMRRRSAHAKNERAWSSTGSVAGGKLLPSNSAKAATRSLSAAADHNWVRSRSM